MTLRSLRTKIFLGFMASVGISVVAFGVLLVIGFQFKSAETVSDNAVQGNRNAVALEQRAGGAKVALYRYLNSVEATDRAMLDAQLREVAPVTSGGAGLTSASKAASDLIQQSQGAAVGLMDSSGNLTPSLVTLGELAAALPDSSASLLVARVNQSFDLIATNLGRLVALRDVHAADSIKENVQRMAGALKDIQALPIATNRVKKVAGVIQRDVEALSDAVDTYRKLMADRGEAFGGLTKAFDAVAGELQARLDASNAAFADANAATATASARMMTSLVVSAVAVLAIGLGLAFLVGRSITRPIIALTRVMGSLANADYGCEVGGQARKDEIGAMARAVEVFKANGLSLVEKEREALESQARADAERARNDATAATAAAEQALVVAAIGSGLTRLAEGDLTCRLDDAFPRDYRKLQEDFNAAMQQLQATIATVVSTTNSIQSGTGEITQAADDLSRRTEQQAASLEETAAALDEITATVTRTAEGSNQARALMTAARERAESSGAVMSGAVSAMADIEKSSKQIGQIIGVIDEIAFQTNLLALNAGVEAARAGDAGRGFAVVASEVRALAQRSADAAKEIKALIGISMKQVSQGVTLVGDTGRALGEIVVDVGKVSETIAAIAASAQEQATGLHEVNSAVNQMDQVTQQNAAMVEQSTAASHALSHEAQELARLTARFTVGSEADMPAPGPAAAAARARPARSTGNAARKPAPVEQAEQWEEF